MGYWPQNIVGEDVAGTWTVASSANTPILASVEMIEQMVDALDERYEAMIAKTQRVSEDLLDTAYPVSFYDSGLQYSLGAGKTAVRCELNGEGNGSGEGETLRVGAWVYFETSGAYAEGWYEIVGIDVDDNGDVRGDWWDILLEFGSETSGCRVIMVDHLWTTFGAHRLHLITEEQEANLTYVPPVPTDGDMLSSDDMNRWGAAVNATGDLFTFSRRNTPAAHILDIDADPPLYNTAVETISEGDCGRESWLSQAQTKLHSARWARIAINRDWLRPWLTSLSNVEIGQTEYIFSIATPDGEDYVGNVPYGLSTVGDWYGQVWNGGYFMPCIVRCDVASSTAQDDQLVALEESNDYFTSYQWNDLIFPDIWDDIIADFTNRVSPYPDSYCYEFYDVDTDSYLWTEGAYWSGPGAGLKVFMPAFVTTFGVPLGESESYWADYWPGATHCGLLYPYSNESSVPANTIGMEWDFYGAKDVQCLQEFDYPAMEMPAQNVAYEMPWTALCRPRKNEGWSYGSHIPSGCTWPTDVGEVQFYELTLTVYMDDEAVGTWPGSDTGNYNYARTVGSQVGQAVIEGRDGEDENIVFGCDLEENDYRCAVYMPLSQTMVQDMSVGGTPDQYVLRASLSIEPNRIANGGAWDMFDRAPPLGSWTDSYDYMACEVRYMPGWNRGGMTYYHPIYLTGLLWELDFVYGKRFAA